jgi:hypothetical protein
MEKSVGWQRTLGVSSISWGARRGSQILTWGLHLWRFRFVGLTPHHSSPRRLVKRCKYSKVAF